ncbi:hypothetical protein PDJAM_G00100100, partial [Pangasius djambal]|nr:hypothetical protein [Pangasius djambal]
GVDVVAPLQDLPACRPTPVYCPAPPGWYVHHIVTDSPLPPTPVREAQFAAIATHAVTLQRQDADQEKPKQVTKKKEPPVKKRKVTPTKKATVSKGLKVKAPEEKVTQKRKGRVTPKEKIRLIPHRREVPKLTKPIRSAGPAKRKAKVMEKGKEEKKGVKDVKPTVEDKTKSKPLKAKQAALPDKKERRAAKPAPKEKKPTIKTAPEEAEVTSKPAPEEKGADSEEKPAVPPVPTKESKVEENVTERKKPGKIPYFQCVLVGGKASQYPLRPLSPAMTPAINPAMMRAMMEQRASVLEQKARPAGQ